jgi:hypothetical protein
MADAVRSTHGKPLFISAAVVVAIAVVALLGYGYASPYIALDRLKRAADARDAETVNQYVDFPALRESLKQQVTELLMRRVDTEKHHNPFAAIGAMIGAALIGPLVDAYATPDGVAALLNGMPPSGKPGERPPEPPDGAASAVSKAPPAPSAPTAGSGYGSTPDQAQQPAPPRSTAGYRGINEFVVTYDRRDTGDTRYSAILHRDGLFSWKLVAVDLGG